MKKDYTSSYLKNYVFQILATVIGFLSLFIVVPFISENQTLYGIYSVCVSLSVFFNYADLGLLTAGQKYAGEYYAQGNKKDEIRIIGFTSFLLLCFFLIIGICFLPFAIKPDLLIQYLKPEDSYIASGLIIALICSSPFIAFRRVLYLVYSIRIEQYKYQIISLTSHVVKIISVFFFFGNGHYLLVEYFVFIQIIDVLATTLLFVMIFVKYEYTTLEFLKSFKYDRDIWHKINKLVVASLFTTISWILYYELDLLIISRISKPEIVALYSVAFTILSLSRNYLAVIYSSFSARYNHFVGQNDYEGLKKFYVKNLIILFPFVCFPIIIFVISGDAFVASWVGNEYQDSIILSKILLLGNLFAFVSYPSQQYVTATNNIRGLYLLSIILPIIFYTGIGLSYFYWGIYSFAIFKAIAQLTSSIYSFIISLKKMSLNLGGILGSVAKNYSLSLLVVVLLSYVSISFMDSNKDAICLMKNILIMGFVFLVALIVIFWHSKYFKSFALSVVQRIKY
ncbi:lipopolysaccharide biosynthesis protein [Bacteroides eggerthii]|jgi:putative lipopolysaccharide biosynthesis related polysaccharide transporter/flippase|uniref:lipopolysaccharide biosynthesis protein n=2 Tax=Bacteroides eggerthii TaxID=28111 RepID=UPI00321BFDD7